MVFSSRGPRLIEKQEEKLEKPEEEEEPAKAPQEKVTQVREQNRLLPDSQGQPKIYSLAEKHL